MLRNRHFAEWRFLLFTMIVTVILTLILVEKRL